jgi:hypothetical protein
MLQNQQELAEKLAHLKIEHRDLDTAIAGLAAIPGTDQLRLGRLKRRKLLIKDYIARLESLLIPDLDA